MKSIKAFRSLVVLLAAIAATPYLPAKELLQDSFDDQDYTAKPAWVTEQPEFFRVQDGALELLNGGDDAKISVKLEKPTTEPIEVTFEVSGDATSGDGHWIMISISDSESGSGYSIVGSNLETMFVLGTQQASGFAWGRYGEMTNPGLPGLALNKDMGPQQLKVTFDPADQKIRVEKDGEAVIEGYGDEGVSQIDSIDFRLSEFPNGPSRLIDNILISSPAKAAP